MEVTTLDRAEGCDLTVDLVSDELPDLSGIDVCVSNAAITDTIAPAHRMTPEQWARDIEVNLTGAFRAVQACLAGMRERRWGRIVVISSGAATSGLRGQVAYSASKAGLLGMVKTLAGRERPPRDHRQRGAARDGRDREGAGDARRGDGAGRWRCCPRAAWSSRPRSRRLVAYLCAEESAQVTGQEIAVDGGAGLNTFTLGSQRPG